MAPTAAPAAAVHQEQRPQNLIDCMYGNHNFATLFSSLRSGAQINLLSESHCRIERKNDEEDQEVWQNLLPIIRGKRQTNHRKTNQSISGFFVQSLFSVLEVNELLETRKDEAKNDYGPRAGRQMIPFASGASIDRFFL